MLRFLNSRFFVFLSIAVAAGCSKTDLPTSSSGGGGGASNPSVGTVDNSAGFYVKALSPTGVTYDLHKSTAYSTDCKAAQNESVYCYLEGQEWDLYHQGVTFQINVPSNMCAYVEENPFWFKKRPYGDGPTTLTVHVDKNGATGYDSDENGVINTAVQTCTYDYTSTGGANCCMGEYERITRTWDTTSGAYVETSRLAGVKWGGSYGNCAAGPATTTQPSNATTGLPLSLSYFVESTGLNKTYAIEAPIKKSRISNIWIANFFDVAAVPAGLDNGPQNLYLWQCLDHAYEVQAEIKVMIREWNQASQFALRTTTGDPNTTGNETTPTGGTGIWGANNDRLDWEDFAASYPGFRYNY